MNSPEKYLQNILEGLVQFPEEIKIDRQNDEMGILLSIQVSPEDIGKIIGKSGETAKAIRRIMNSHGFLNQQRVSVKIVDAMQ